MLQQAIEKLSQEVEKEKNNRNVKIIGQFLIEYVKAWPDTAPAFCAADKTVSGSYKAMEDYARKLPRQGNCVALSPDEGFEQVLKYYGINHADGTSPIFESKFIPKQSESKTEDETGFSLNLADLF